MKVHQILATASPRDAVTHHALRWQKALHDADVDGGVFAENLSPGAPPEARRLSSGALPGGDAIVLHYSIASAATERALAQRGPRLGYYQNVTPGDLLRPYNAEVADLCDRARSGLDAMAQLDAVGAPSQFNAEDLRAVGIDDITIIPLGIDAVAPPQPKTAADAPTVISVGRIAPNKRIEDVIRVFALFQRNRAPGASLELVGNAESFSSYEAALHLLIEELGVERVTLHGSISDRRLDELYRRADAYLCMSVHEGFCVPLIEALTHAIPVVARAAGAIPETLGEAGVVVDDDDLALFAEALVEVVGSATLRSQLRDAGAERCRALDGAHIAEQVRNFVLPAVGQ